MHDERASVQGLVDQLRAGVEAQRLGELVDLVAVEVPGAGVFAGVEVARQRTDFLADVDGRQLVGACNVAGDVSGDVSGDVAGGFRAGAEENHGKRHQPGGFRVNAGGGDAHGCERGLLLGGEVMQSGLELRAGARVVVVLAGVPAGSACAPVAAVGIRGSLELGGCYRLGAPLGSCGGVVLGGGVGVRRTTVRKRNSERTCRASHPAARAPRTARAGVP